MTPDGTPSWTVLLIGGNFGSGKSTVAAELGRRFGISWMQVDDLRLAFQRARVSLPENNEALYFDQDPNYWRLEPEAKRDSLIAVGEVLSAPLEVVIENHVDQDAPIVIEGDGILPSLIDRPSVMERQQAIRSVFLVETDESALLGNLLERTRLIEGRTQEEMRVEGRGKWLFGQWLVREAKRRQLE